MPCVLSWSLRLRYWLHLFPSNLASPSSKYDKLTAEPIICVWLLFSLVLSQPCPAELLDHFCPPYGSTKVRAIMSGGILSQKNQEFEELLTVALCALEKPRSSQWLHSDVKIWDTLYKPYKYHFSCLFFPTQNKLNLCCKTFTHLLDLLPWANKYHWQNLNKNAGYLWPGFTNIIVQCLLYFHFSVLMLSWENIHWVCFTFGTWAFLGIIHLIVIGLFIFWKEEGSYPS